MADPLKLRLPGFKYIVVSIVFLLLGFCAAYFIILNDNSKQDDFIRQRRDESHSPSQAFGSVYTRWGRTVCPSETELVYSGVAGGGHYTHEGSGSNYLCLPLDPIYGNVVPGVQNPAIVYGAEYEIKDLLSNQNAENYFDHNVPCAVCRSKSVTILMIPARNECYEGWKREYDGYLMASHHSHKGRSEFVCMDHDPEADKSGFRDENGALFYLTEGACGSLPCPPYDNGKELTCVVCSK